MSDTKLKMGNDTSHAGGATMVPAQANGLFRFLRALWPIVVSFGLIGCVWELSVNIFEVPPLLLPKLSDVLATFRNELVAGLYWQHIGVTLYETLIGFLAGTACGVLMAGLLTYVKRLEQYVYPVLIVLQTFPKIAVAPLLITWFGFGVVPKIVLGAVLAFFPVLVNMLAGFTAVPAAQIELLRVFSSSEWKIFRIARFPAALPYLFSAMQTGVVLTLLGVITGEFVGARSGLGYLIIQKNSVLAIDSVFSILFLLGFVGVVIHLGMKALHRRIVFWGN